MRPRLLAIVPLLLLVPLLAGAQMGGRRGGMGGGGGRGGRGGAPGGSDDRAARPDIPAAPLTRTDLERFDPVALVIERRVMLDVSDVQAQRLDSIHVRLLTRIEPMLVRVDSLAKSVLSLSDSSAKVSDDGRRDLIQGRMALTRAVNLVRTQHDSATREALLVLDDAQRPKAAALIADQQRRLDEMTRPRKAPADTTGGGGRRRPQ